MISEEEILSSLKEYIIVKDKDNKIVYSNVDNPRSFEEKLICRGSFSQNITDNTDYQLSKNIVLAIDNQMYTIYTYSKCNVNDYLTNVLKREFFETAFYTIADKYNSFVIIMGDVDKFKDINDNYGHQIGDRVLNYVGKVLQNNMTKDDIVGRYGGEEFIMCLPNRNIEDAYNLVEKIRTEISSVPLCVENEKVNVTITFGVANYSYNKTYDELVYEADSALLYGKNSGRNKTIIYTYKVKQKRFPN